MKIKMKIDSIYTVALAMLLALAGCTPTVDITDDQESGSTTLPQDATNVETFEVEFDYSDLTEPAETVPTDATADGYDDYVENSEFDKNITITYSNGTASLSGDVGAVAVVQQGAHVVVTSETKQVGYTLTGSSTNGSFKIYSSNKFKVTLQNLHLTNPTGAALNIQSKKRMFLILEEGSTNTLADGTTYTAVEGEDMKGTFFSEGQAIFSGKGTLQVNANCKHAIVSDDYLRFRAGVKISIAVAQGNAVKANENIIVDGGVLNLNVLGSASKGFSSDGHMTINGGRSVVLTSGGAIYKESDVSGASGIKVDSTLTINGGTIALKSTGSGGKGISADGNLVINDGSVKVVTTGKQYVYGSLDTSAKGIKSDANLTINGGTVLVRTLGGEGSEGIESKAALAINGGLVAVYAYDDCLNASNSIAITKGTVYCSSTNNDAIDSNGTLTISGGTTIAVGATSPEAGIDCDKNTFIVSGGILIGVGGASSTPTASRSTQPTILYGGKGTQGQYCAINDSDGKTLLAYRIPRTYNQMTLLLSHANLQRGKSYTLSSGGSVSGGVEFQGLILDGTYSGGTTLGSATLSSMVTTYGSVSGGGRP